DIFDLLPQSGWFNPPVDRMVQTPVCQQSGHLAGPDCPDPETIYLPVTGLKSTVCPYHRTIHTNAAGNLRVTADCTPVTEIVRRQWFVLPPTMAYYYKTRHSNYHELPPYAPGCISMDQNQVMEMIYPKNNAKIYIPLEING